MYFVYILESLVQKKYYVGYTQDLQERLSRHNAGREKFTKKFLPWKIIYTEELLTRAMAVRREKQIKAYKGGEAFKELIDLIKSN
jgi:putative endonuclease